MNNSEEHVFEITEEKNQVDLEEAKQPKSNIGTAIEAKIKKDI